MLFLRRRKTPERRSVPCTECDQLLNVSARALSTSCPHCHQRVRLEDVIVKSFVGLRRMATTGLLSVERGGNLNAKVRAAELKLLGRIKGNVTILGSVSMGRRADFQGRLEASSVHLEQGARLRGHLLIGPPDSRS